MLGYLCAQDNKDPKTAQQFELELTEQTLANGTVVWEGVVTVPPQTAVKIVKGTIYSLKLVDDKREGVIQITEIEQDTAIFRGKAS